MDKISKIFGFALIAAILCFALVVAILFAFLSPAPQGAAAPAPSVPLPASTLPPNASIPNESLNSTPAVNSSPPGNITLPSQAELDWVLISKSSVESACLSQAKKTVAASGYNEGLVFSCACSAQESSSVKSYGCSVSALDGQHPVGINCTKSGQACSITAQGSTASYTFDQLQALANP